jgi:hypothetical protein
MALLTPPPKPPRIALGENDGLRRARLRLWQIEVSAMTVFLTAWCCTLGPFPAIVALMVAKDVMVAILVMGLDVGAPVDSKTSSSRGRGWPR